MMPDGGLLDSLGSGISGGLLDPKTAALMGLAQGLLAGSGPSRMPVSFGSALASGMQGAMGGVSNAYQLRQQDMNQRLLQMKLAAMSAPSPFDGGQPAPQSMPQQAPQQMAPMSSLMSGAGPSGTPITSTPTGAQQPPAQVPMSGVFGGADPKQAFKYGMYLTNAGVPAGAEIMKAAVEMSKPTDFDREMQSAGIAPGSSAWQQAAQGRIASQTYIKPLSGGAGDIYRNPLNPSQVLATNPNMATLDLGDHFQAVDKTTLQNGQTFPIGISPQSQVSNALIRQKMALEYGLDPTQQAGNDALARGIATGQFPPPTGPALASPRNQQIMGKVLQDNPGYDYTQITAKKTAQTDFMSGSLGNQMRSFATAGQHLDMLGNLVDGLSNTNSPLFNKVANTYKDQTGNPAPTNFEAAKDVVAKEVMKAIVAGGGGQGEREALSEAMDNAKSPQQLKGVIQTYRDLMGAQYGNLLEQRRAAGLSDSTLPNYKGSQQTQAPAVTRTGTLNGHKVIQYSDGTIKYAD